MLSSLPSLFPHDPHALWYHSHTTTDHSTTTNPSNPDPTTNLSTNDPHPQPLSQQSTPHNPRPTPLTLLAADESALALRKTNIRRFGANWLRPPGLTKTLQGLHDERLEREEAERAAAREAAAQDAAEAQAVLEEEAAEAERLREMGTGAGDEVGGRDLDEDVPEAEGEEAWSDDDVEGDVVSMLGGEEGEVEGDGDFVGEDAVSGVVGMTEVDLGDEVPEAEGSYEHTDTEVEDSSSDGGDVVGAGGRVGSGSGVRGQGPLLGTFDRRTGEVVRGGGREVFGSSPLVRAQIETPGRSGMRGRGGREN